MKRLELNVKNVIAFILLAVNLFVILSCGYSIAANEGFISGASSATVEVPEDMYLTFKEDVSLDSTDEQIFIPKGTVIKPDYIYRSRIGFYFSAEGYDIEECKGMSNEEKEEKGIYFLRAKPEFFVEYEEIERLCDEAAERGRSTRTKTILKVFIPILAICIVWFVGWFSLTWFLCRKKMYVLLYVLDVVILPVIYLGSSMFLRH